MAASPGNSSPRLIELSALAPGALNALLEEETERWRRMLQWDFRASAELVARYAGYRALEGFALVEAGEAVGYGYWVLDERKGLIGDLYVRNAWRNAANEVLLLEAILRQLRRQPWVRRVEAQLLQLGHGASLSGLTSQPERFARHFMLAKLDRAAAFRPVVFGGEIRFERWHMRLAEAAAALIARVYEGHVDSRINDQYKSPDGAMRFLQNIVQYPGCGKFAPECSLLALEASGEAAGLLLATRVSEESGHIAQLCVSPRRRGAGLAYELLRRGMVEFSLRGADFASLTVTAANRPAIGLYERFGFASIHHFEAQVWDPL